MQAGVLLLLLVCCTAVYAGSKCPKRQYIYPCTCSDLRLSRKKTHTVVTCTGLKNTEQLNSILPALQNMEIDVFYLYDSFWEAKMLGAVGESQRVLPNDWISLTNIKKMEIHDTTLSSCFACNWTAMCRNTITTSFIVDNSTSSEKICTLCGTSSGSRVPWMGCMAKLENVQLSHGKLKSVTTDFFPLAYRELISLDLSHNQIGKIDTNAFRNLPNLKHLDLSHNNIEHLDHTFGQRTKIEYLDVSHNVMKVIGSNLIPLMPRLRIVNFAHNQIIDFKLSDWQRVPANITSIDLTGNSINCDCTLKWLNETMPVSVAIPGKCASPDEYKESRFRPTSRNLIERCTANGVLGSRKKDP